MELTFLKVKTFLEKALLFVKLYWKLILVSIGLIYLILFVKRKNDLVVELLAQRERMRKEHQDNIDRLNQQIQTEVAVRRKIESDFQNLIERINREHNEEIKRIASVREQEIKALIAKHHNDPVIMAQTINDLFGIPVMPVPTERQPWEPQQ
jgi:DNA anti-recombination protein RmuC